MPDAAPVSESPFASEYSYTVLRQIELRRVIVNKAQPSILAKLIGATVPFRQGNATGCSGNADAPVAFHCEGAKSGTEMAETPGRRLLRRPYRSIATRQRKSPGRMTGAERAADAAIGYSR